MNSSPPPMKEPGAPEDEASLMIAAPFPSRFELAGLAAGAQRR